MADEKDSKWQCYIIPDLATWTGAAGSKPHTPIEFYDTYCALNPITARTCRRPD